MRDLAELYNTFKANENAHVRYGRDCRRIAHVSLNHLKTPITLEEAELIWDFVSSMMYAGWMECRNDKNIAAMIKMHLIDDLPVPSL